MKSIRSKQTGYVINATNRFTQNLADNLSWGVNQKGRKVQLLDRGGFVFDLDKQGRIIRMKDNAGRVFKYR